MMRRNRRLLFVLGTAALSAAVGLTGTAFGLPGSSEGYSTEFRSPDGRINCSFNYFVGQAGCITGTGSKKRQVVIYENVFDGSAIWEVEWDRGRGANNSGGKRLRVKRRINYGKGAVSCQLIARRQMTCWVPSYGVFAPDPVDEDIVISDGSSGEPIDTFDNRLVGQPTTGFTMFSGCKNPQRSFTAPTRKRVKPCTKFRVNNPPKS